MPGMFSLHGKGEGAEADKPQDMLRQTDTLPLLEALCFRHLTLYYSSSWTSCPIRQNQSCQLYSSHCVHFDKIRVAAVTFRTERLPHSTELYATHMNGLFVKCLKTLKMSMITTLEWRLLGKTQDPYVDQIRTYASEYVTVKCTKTPVCHLTDVDSQVNEGKDLSNTSSWLVELNNNNYW